jgi:hypothetical protein
MAPHSVVARKLAAEGPTSMELAPVARHSTGLSEESTVSTSDREVVWRRFASPSLRRARIPDVRGGAAAGRYLADAR